MKSTTVLFTVLASGILILFAAPGRAAELTPCPENLNVPCERPLPPCTPVERPCQR
jgi:hypothetical protein